MGMYNSVDALNIFIGKWQYKMKVNFNCA